MSHFSTVKTQMVDAAFLTQALRDLGCAVEEGNLKLRGFMNQGTSVQIIARTGRWSYAIGFRKVGDHFAIVADWWGVRGVKRETFVRQVTQRYSYHAARAKLEQQGFTLASEETDREGRIRLVLRRMT